MSHLTPVGGNHIGRRRQASGTAELRHHFPAREALFSAAGVFRIGQHALQLFTNLNRFIQAPGAVRVKRHARLRETFSQRHNRLGLFFTRQHAAFEFEIVEAIFFVSGFCQTHDGVRGHGLFMTKPVPVALLIALTLIGQRRGVTVTHEEQVAQHFDFATLLALAQQRGDVDAQMLSQQIQQRGFNPGDNVNGGTQIKSLQTAAAGVTVGKAAAYCPKDVFIFAERFPDDQFSGLFQRLADFLSAGDFPYAGMA